MKNQILAKQTWLKFLTTKWLLSDIEAKHAVDSLNDIYRGPSIKLQELYPLAHPMAFDIFSNEAVGLECSKNTAAFLGFVGAGNQSVQTITPFPALSLVVRETWFSLFEEFTRSLFDKMKSMAPTNSLSSKGFEIRRCPSSTAKKQNLFCTPFTCTSNGISSSYILPRFIAYYEVLVTKRAKSEAGIQLFNPDEEFDAAAECVAVGLATKSFELKRLPGWDNDSYGYHGDDGAIFHGRGRQLATYGPSFGASDTVGCGIDYESRSIFFTLNGKYQGTAFSGVDLTEGQVLYPTVGIDAAVNVTFNFGREKFKFDLKAYISKREDESKILQSFSPTRRMRRSLSRIFIQS